MESRNYKIRTVADIAALEPDQAQRCIEDLKMWVEYYRRAKELERSMQGIVEVHTPDYMDWYDDGENGGTIHVNFKDKDGNELLPEISVKVAP